MRRGRGQHFSGQIGQQSGNTAGQQLPGGTVPQPANTTVPQPAPGPPAMQHQAKQMPKDQPIPQTSVSAVQGDGQMAKPAVRTR